jgi:hypothetical protein
MPTAERRDPINWGAMSIASTILSARDAEGGRQLTFLPSCLVAERHWDEVGWAIAENAWRFETVSNEAL